MNQIPASSGKTNRHRLNRGGDRQANAALYRIVIVRLCHDPRTQAYMGRRTAEAMSHLSFARGYALMMLKNHTEALQRFEQVVEDQQ